MTRPRLRDLGIKIGTFAPGPLNAITDVEGVMVGHHTLISGEGPLEVGKGPVRTGVTAILPNGGDIFDHRVTGGAFVLNGAGELSGLTQVQEWGLIETPIILSNTLAVGACGEAVVQYMVERNPGIGQEHDVLIPLVGECDDSWLNDAAGGHVQAEHVHAALNDAKSGPVAEGAVGGGTGMVTCDLKGGIGTSSRVISLAEGAHKFSVGVLVMSNFGILEDLRIDGYPLGKKIAKENAAQARRLQDYGSIITVVATDAPLLPHQLVRLSKRAALGIGRTGSVAAHGSGEIIIAFSTANTLPRVINSPIRELGMLQDRFIDPLYRSVIDATEEAILNALVAADPMTGRDGHHIDAVPHDQIRRIAELTRFE